MKLRMTAWSPLLDRDNPQHALLLPILLNCVDEHGSPVVSTSDHAHVRMLRHRVHANIPVAVEGIRQYWMPIRYARAS
jgi:uncharacterized protein